MDLQKYIGRIHEEGYQKLFPDYAAQQIRFENGIILQLNEPGNFFSLQIQLTEPLSMEQFVRYNKEFGLSLSSTSQNNTVYASLKLGPYHFENIRWLKLYFNMLLDILYVVEKQQIGAESAENVIIENAELYHDPAELEVRLSQYAAMEEFITAEAVPGITNIMIIYGRRGVGKSTCLKAIFKDHKIQAYKLQNEGGLESPELIKKYTVIVKELRALQNPVLVINHVLSDFLLKNDHSSFTYHSLLRFIIEVSYGLPICLISNQTELNGNLLLDHSRTFHMKGETDESVLLEILARKNNTLNNEIFDDKGQSVANPLYSIIKNTTIFHHE